MPVEQIMRTRLEIEIVLGNYEIILHKAEKMDPDFSSDYAKQLLNIIFNSYMRALKQEIEALKNHIDDEITKRIMDKIIEMNDRNSKRKNVSAAQLLLTKPPSTSPVVLLLKMAVQSNAISFASNEKMGHHKWGRLKSFHEYLHGLKFKETRGHKKYWPGLPGCILSLVPIWTDNDMVISASNDRFDQIPKLANNARNSRDEYLNKLLQSCSGKARNRIEKLKSTSDQFVTEHRKDIRGDVTIYQYESLVRRSKIRPVHLPGILAAWSPQAFYMPACLLDHCRFLTLRPRAAEDADQKDWYCDEQENWYTTKKIYTSDSCAEWDAFLQLASAQNSEMKVTDPDFW